MVNIKVSTVCSVTNKTLSNVDKIGTNRHILTVKRQRGWFARKKCMFVWLWNQVQVNNVPVSVMEHHSHQCQCQFSGALSRGPSHQTDRWRKKTEITTHIFSADECWRGDCCIANFSQIQSSWVNPDPCPVRGLQASCRLSKVCHQGGRGHLLALVPSVRPSSLTGGNLLTF